MSAPQGDSTRAIGEPGIEPPDGPTHSQRRTEHPQEEAAECDGTGGECGGDDPAKTERGPRGREGGAGSDDHQHEQGNLLVEPRAPRGQQEQRGTEEQQGRAHPERHVGAPDISQEGNAGSPECIRREPEPTAQPVGPARKQEGRERHRGERGRKRHLHY